MRGSQFAELSAFVAVAEQQSFTRPWFRSQASARWCRRAASGGIS